MPVAFAISLALHAIAVGGSAFSWTVGRPRRSPPALEVVYERAAVESELQELQRALAQAKREALGTSMGATLSAGMQIRVPEFSLPPTEGLNALMAGAASVVDLAHLSAAAQGDPIRLSYFSAIRDQIRDAANRRMWMTPKPSEGLVRVTFILSSNGRIERMGVVGESSTPSDALQTLALKIVSTAAPFPPFPPSMSEPRQAIMVPLEFRLGAAGAQEG